MYSFIYNKAKFNDAQNGVYNAVMESVNNNTGKTSCTVQVVVEKLLFATPSLLLSDLKAKSPFVSHHQELLHFF